ncbi:helix-turn-helix domain-containing protein [Bacillus thuringiensis]|uniref:helix-turn-helix domain-containing protein n=1 Tax=Bacillus thuringiensis TaxID=1428 RepID=UPI0026E328F9|nr:XRE family transcriptional regulator [Bacillus thuringiensis]MDO6630489.1 XRE family transcriptional regulator [Bacillus thuringiensis]MDO6660686.1 XRE family transcriptional regulator [Bacillus thuringiensis]MDO6700617.1 XRE family transcriptional regulator [Bacillus thuringiensis]
MSKKIDFANNIKRIRQERNLSKTDFAKLMEVSDVTIGYWERGERTPKTGTIEMLARKLGISTNELIFEHKHQEKKTQTNIIPMAETIPIYGSIAAGCPNWAEDNVIGNLPIPNQLVHRHGIENLVALEIEGDSMNKIVPNGFYAVIDLNMGEVYNGDIVAVRLDCYATTLKRFYKTNNSIILEPDSYNPEHKPFIFDCTNIYECPEIEVIGRYVWSCAPID